MAITLLDDADSHDLSDVRLEDLILRRVASADSLLDASHELLMRVFDASVVNPKFVYVDAITDESRTFRDFPPQYFAGVFAQGSNELLAGFVSSDLMRIGESSRDLQLVIGNIATSPKLRELGFRGVGSSLWRATIDGAKKLADESGLRLAYSVAEAEPASLPFWAKLGYKWPQGIKYFQPPLEFDASGHPLHDEVSETLLVYPLYSFATSVDVSELREMVRAIYWNWSIRPSIHRLNETALSRAKEYVMGRVLDRTLESLPKGGAVQLVEVPTRSAHLG